MASSRRQDKGKTLMGVDTSQAVEKEETLRISRLYFGLASMEAFYISFKDRRDLLKQEGPMESMPCLPSMFVRGRKVRITPEKINAFYWENQACLSTEDGLLKVSQMDHAHKGKLEKLAKAITSLIQQTLKKAMKLEFNKMGRLCAQVDVLENEVVALKEEVDRVSRPEHKP
ncbi:hypothetical protein HAX54_002039 [Datura stramonium]|uniref:Uncharacterized protein n=1 Tax=Datura stramonium TaxID=4076 RepID=A0ABS8WUQ8_DATST|nr:hypothetical protein [Datura stramonium]